MIIRDFSMADFDRVWQLWQVCHIDLGPDDTPERLAVKLERDPDLFLVAEEGEAVLGAVIGTWDGRVGWIYNHAVEPRCRRTGIGSMLTKELERRLKDKGAKETYLLVAEDNLNAQDFYEAQGFREDRGQVVMVKPLYPAEASTSPGASGAQSAPRS